LSFLPFPAGATSSVWKKKTGLTVNLSLPPLSTSIEVAGVEAVVVEAIVEAVVEAVVVSSVQRIPNCRSQDSGSKSSQADPHQTAVKSLVPCEETGVDIGRWILILLRR